MRKQPTFTSWQNVERKTRDLRNVRHNKICDKIAKELKLAIPDAAVQRDRTWRIGLVNLKPDITMKHENKITFVEVTIPYEKKRGGSGTMRRRKRNASTKE